MACVHASHTYVQKNGLTNDGRASGFTGWISAGLGGHESHGRMPAELVLLMLHNLDFALDDTKEMEATALTLLPLPYPVYLRF